MGTYGYARISTLKQSIERQVRNIEREYPNAVIIREAYTGTKINRYLLELAREQIRLAFEQAEKEVSDLHQRTKEGIETARLNGKQIGQRQGAKLTTKKSIAAKGIISRHSKDFGGTLSDAEVMKLAGLTHNTFYKYKRELRTES